MSTHGTDDELLEHVESAPINMDTPKTDEKQSMQEAQVQQTEEGEATNRMLYFGDDTIEGRHPYQLRPRGRDNKVFSNRRRFVEDLNFLYARVPPTRALMAAY
eukprot:SAG11_NODE_16176_length_555_cov_0.905702_1_plen_103_part_00